MLFVGPTIFMDCPTCLVFDLQCPPIQAKFAVSSLALERIINPDELQFLIGLPVDWQSPIRRLCSDQADQLHFWKNNYFIFLFGILLHWYHGVGDVFNIKRSPNDFNFYHVYAGIPSVGNWAFFNPIKVIHILFWLVVTSILYYWVIIWTDVESIGCIFYKL
jgi:hypothetical protein